MSGLIVEAVTVSASAGALGPLPSAGRSLGRAQRVWARHWGVKVPRPRRDFNVHTSTNLGGQFNRDKQSELSKGIRAKSAEVV